MDILRSLTRIGFADIRAKERQHALRAVTVLVNVGLSGISDNLSATNHNTASNGNIRYKPCRATKMK